MFRDFVVFPAGGGWALKVDGAATAILQYETREEAASIGAVMAARRGVSLVIRGHEENPPCVAAADPIAS
ncbi:DUF2188 domain-containing protein [Cupriavidus sp. 2MCAB6]|uniref:DUF2188 domain-containing protein n=1 Tax=Cupriavidus sp. 2MCAB6 TaxID=3232981 RepID=UPI003F91E41F